MRFPTYKAFWPHYVSEHRSALNRNLHFLGTALALLFLCFAIGAGEPGWLALVPVAGYGFSWIGHLWVEKNRPTSWQYPLWSLAADFHMFALMCLGRMNREVKRMSVLNGAA